MHLDELTQEVGGVPAFRRFWIRDINHLSGVSKRRLIYAPNLPMQVVHRRLASLLRPHSVRLRHGTAVVAKSSPVNNVNRHAHNRYFYLLDLASAYVQTDVHLVVATLMAYLPKLEGTEDQFLDFASRHLMTLEGGLATGGPASPDVFNLTMGRLIDEPMGALCQRWGIEYSRYLDDLTFSSLDLIGQRKRAAIRQVILDTGYGISHHKTQVHDLAKSTLTINGVGLELGGRIFTPRAYHRDVAALVHRAMTDTTIKPAVIHGRMGAVIATSPPKGRRNAAERRLDSAYANYRYEQANLSATQ